MLIKTTMLAPLFVFLTGSAPGTLPGPCGQPRSVHCAGTPPSSAPGLIGVSRPLVHAVDPLAIGMHLDTTMTARPSYASDGRLAIELRGDLWLAPDPANPAQLIRLTSGSASDLEPAWTADGRAIIFASDRNGAFHLWHLPVGTSGATAEPTQLTRGAAGDREPTVAPDGAIVFVRGTGTAAQLWVRRPDGAERVLTEEPGGAGMPAISPDGRRVAYSAVHDGRRQLRLLTLAGDTMQVAAGSADLPLAGDFAVEHPAWSPDGERMAFTTGRGRPGVWVVAAEGGYPNQVSTRYARPAWRPDGTRLLLAALPREALGYNGDPDRAVDRAIADPLPYGARLWLVDSPRAIDAGRVEVALDPPASPEDFGAAFDRIWERIARLYYSAPDAASRRARWAELAAKHRPRARRATTASALEGIVHELLQERPPYREEAIGRAGVSSAHPLATAAGLEILRQGGNVVDAAIAVSFAIGVVEPDASGIGGYGQMLIHLQGMTDPALIEFMSRTPEAATLENTALLGATGPVVVNIPGTVDGMWRAWQRFGSKQVSWAELLAPAIRLAEEGFVLDDAFPTTLARERERFLRYEASRALFFPDGRPLQPGELLRNPDLAWTLRQIAEGGADAFYRGEIARRMVEDLAAGGNVMTMRDMARYFAEWREPVRGTYRGHTIYSSAPPVSGGATLVAQLNLLEHLARPGLPTNDAATAHAQIEAWKLVPSGRIADPGLWPVDLEPYLSKDTATARWGCFSADSVVSPEAVARAGCVRPRGRTALAEVAGEAPATALAGASPGAGAVSSGPEPEIDCESGAAPYHVRECTPTGTTTFAVADAEGNMVSVTQTLGTWGGNFYLTPGLGFLYNDKLNSYGRNPDGFGARLPNARHGSTIAPTLVFRGTGEAQRPLLATGAAGNAWITSAVYQVVTGVIDQGLGPQQALEQPRFLLTRQPGAGGSVIIQYEAGYAPALIARLRALGHQLQAITFQGELRMGYGAAVMVDGGQVRAGGDPRRSGAGGAIR
jgi:gamma-glutamyltranspeptidase